MNYQIREMTINDIKDVIKGEKKAFGSSLGYDLLYQELTLNPFAFYFVVEIEQKVHGYIGVWINKNAEILNFYVDKKYQNQGYGKMLLNFVLDLCKQCNVRYISLEVRVSNHKAISLYEKHGFIQSYHRKAYYSNGEDAIVMIKDFEVDK